MAITKILAPNGSEIYIQYDVEESDYLSARGANPIGDITKRTEQFKESLVTTINSYSQILLDSVQKGVNGLTNPNQVTLEFGLQMGGEAGILFVSKGTAQANVKVKIEC
ncbi:CU044_2847 family protein [Nostoc sp.]|uniref:CU044_2847 family protein n=1 Tax=Nostoc sp. TaxID=1180 RepID=UPI002FFB6A6B